jgi:hypothetical protein
MLVTSLFCLRGKNAHNLKVQLFTKVGMVYSLTDLNYPITKIFSASPAELLQKRSPGFRLHLLHSSKKDAGISRGDAIVDTLPNCKHV